jgi:hypothetical protein
MRFLRRKKRFESALREASEEEQAVLDRLLREDFPGAETLRKQSQDLQVRRIDRDGSLELRPGEGAPRADVDERVPVEAELKDRDGFMIHVLLHVVDGLMNELDIYKDNLRPPQRDLVAEELRVFSLKDPS